MRTPLLLALPLLLTAGCRSAPAPVPPAASTEVAPDAWKRDEATAALEQRAGALLDVHQDWQPVFTHDGKRVVFGSDRDGLPQLYVAEVAAPQKPPRRLVEWKDPIQSALITWDDRFVIFVADHEGDELTRFFRVPLEGGAVEPLTPEALNRDPAFLPELTPDRLVFSARELDAKQTGVWALSLKKPGPAQRLYLDEGAGFLLDVSRDGRRGLFARFKSHQDNPLFLIDFDKGTARTLYPTSGAATVRNASFSPDGRRAYALTDGGGEQALVLSLDVEKGTEVARYAESAPSTAVMEAVLTARQGSWLAVAMDAGDRVELRVLDGRTLKPGPVVKLPLGRGQLGAISDDGKQLALNWSTPDHPAQLFNVTLATGAVTPLRSEKVPRLEGLPAVAVSRETVPSFDGTPIPVNVYRPAQGAERRPVIVWLHGGPAGASSLGWSGGTRFLLSQGYAWVEPNIRGSGGFGRAFEAADDGERRPDSFKDITAVREWVAAQPWADPARLVVAGGSFGGYLVLNELTANPLAWRAGVDAYGIADFITFMDTTKGLVRENYLHEIGDPAKQAALLQQLSPLRRVDQIARPLFVYAGANDPRVPRAQSDAIVKALRGRGVTVEYMVGANEGHGLDRRENRVEYSVRVAQFLERATR